MRRSGTQRNEKGRKRGRKSVPQPPTPRAEFQALPLVCNPLDLVNTCIEEKALATLANTLGREKDITQRAWSNPAWISRDYHLFRDGYEEYAWQINFPNRHEITLLIDTMERVREVKKNQLLSSYYHQWIDKGCLRATAINNAWEGYVVDFKTPNKYAWIVISNRRLFTAAQPNRLWQGNAWAIDNPTINRLLLFAATQCDLYNTQHKAAFRRELSTWHRGDMPESVIDSVIMEYYSPDEVLYLPSSRSNAAE